MAKENEIRIVKSASAPNEGASFVDAESTPKKTIQELTPEEEQLRLKQLAEALSNATGVDTSLYQSGQNILYRKNLSKAEKFFTFTTLVAPLFEDIHRPSPHFCLGGKDSDSYGRHLRYMYMLAQGVLSYFNGASGSEEWYMSVIVPLGDECLAPVVRYRGPYETPTLEFLKSIDERLGVAEKINTHHPLDQYGAKARSMVETISDRLKQLVDREYYLTRDVYSRQREANDPIASLAQKYNIELPSKEEIFERDIVVAIRWAERAIASVAKLKTDDPYIRNDAIKTAKEGAIQSVRDILKDAERCFTDSKIPLGIYGDLSDPVAHLEKELEGATLTAIRNAYKDMLEKLKPVLLTINPYTEERFRLDWIVNFVKKNSTAVTFVTARNDLEGLKEYVKERVQTAYIANYWTNAIDNAIKKLQ